MAERLRVLFITPGYPFSGDGLRRDSLPLLVDALAEQGVEAHIVAPDMRGLSTSDSTLGAADTVGRFRVASPATLGRSKVGEVDRARGSRRATSQFLGAGFGSAVKIGRDFKPDIVHAHWWFPAGLVGSWISALSSLPLVTSLHGIDVERTRAGSPARPLFRHVLKRSTIVTVDSAAQLQRVVASHSGATPVVAPLPLPVELLRGTSGPRRLVTVSVNGRVDMKQLPSVVRMIRELGLEPVIVTGQAGNGLSDLLGDAGERDVTVHSDRGDAKFFAAQLGESLACVFLGVGEQQRVLAYAGMLAGSPTILIDSSDIRDVVSDGLAGVLIPDMEFDSQLSLLSTKLSDRVSLARLGEAARMSALASVAPESCASRMLGVYLRAIDEIST